MSQGMAKVFSPAEAGRELGCSASTVKRMAAELKIDPLLTQSGARLFTAEMLERIRAERERRAREAGR
ncbi:MAG: DUF3853 family protein [Verrucomicrobia bacterium]|nr:DUF3853 family protein [Verrucomicrobiota bacterium]